MGSGKRERITVETERILIIACGRGAHGWCEKCGSEVGMLTADVARQLLEVGPEQLKNHSQRKLHLERAANGLVVRLKSLLRLARSSQH